MTPSIRRTAIRKKASVVSIAATPASHFDAKINFCTPGNDIVIPQFGGESFEQSVRRHSVAKRSWDGNTLLTMAKYERSTILGG